MSNLPLSQQSLPVRATEIIYVTTTLYGGLPQICTGGAIKQWLAGIMGSARREPFARSFTRWCHILQRNPLTSGSIVFAINYLSSDCPLQEIVCAELPLASFREQKHLPDGEMELCRPGFDAYSARVTLVENLKGLPDTVQRAEK